MGSRSIPHPPSTNFDDEQRSPPAKRLKTSESTDGDLLSEDDSSVRTPNSYRYEIPDSEDESTNSENEDARKTSSKPTELESALPPVKTDKEAIQEYEAMRAADDSNEALNSRLKDRSWTRGKSSIYVDAFNLALETVLEDEGHLFDEKETEVFEQWRNLGYEAQYLYVRLFLRKTSVWHRISKLGYYGDISDLPVAVEILQKSRALPDSSAKAQINPAELNPPESTVLDSDFTFADSSDNSIATLQEASSLLSLEELKVIAREAKIKGKNKTELLQALHNMSRQQSGLGWVGLKRSESELTSVSESGDNDTDAEDIATSDKNRDGHFLRKIMASTGPCIRLSAPTLNLFERVHLVFYRSTEWSEKSLTTIILARISRRVFPDYIVSRSANIFSTRSDLLEFEAALRAQFRVDNILEMNGNPGKKGMEEVLVIFDAVYPRWKVLLEEEQRKEDRVYETGEGAYLRRFSPAWVYTRIIHKGTYVLGRFKMHAREHEVLSELLNQHLFHAARRGSWYQRKALLEEHYMYAIQPPAGISDPEKQKRHWKRISLQTCEQGLQDNDCHMIYHYDLQKRIKKIEKNIRIPMREQHDFDHVLLAKPLEVTVEGVQIKKNYPPTLKRQMSGQPPVEEKQRSTKTIWVDEAEGGGECSVEAMCLSDYRSRGFKGYHAEGGIIRTLFAYLFFDVLFVYIPNVFQTAYQTCPLDLHTDAFYPSRASEINHRLVEISNGDAASIIRSVDAREREKGTCVIGLRWEFELDDLLEIVDCFSGEALATVCKVMAQEYRVRGGGIPDLFLWNTETKEVRFVEVKSENDRLSDTQRLWIHVLTGAGVKVELCNAVAKEVRVVDV